MTSGRGYVGENHRSVKRSNRAMIFRAIHALGPIARVDLARQTGLNPGTVSNIVDALLADGLASETGYGSSGRAGRRPVHLEVNPSARYAVGVDVARDVVTGALIDLSGGVRGRTTTPRGDRRELGLLEAQEVIESLLYGITPAERATVVGIGVGLPSPVNVGADRYLTPHSFSAWHDLNIRNELSKLFGLPTYVDNNANTGALAELWFGAGRGVDSFVLLTLGTGVGTGLVLEGNLYRGHGLAGEGGHITVNLDGPRCSCGNFGCLEMYVSVPSVIASVRAALATGEASTLKEDTGSDLSITTVIAALKDGDGLVRRVFTDVARYMAAGLVNIMNTLDPELILLGRELSDAGDALLEPVRSEVRMRVFPVMKDSVRIEAAGLEDAPVIGAGTLVLNEYFAAPFGGAVTKAKLT